MKKNLVMGIFLIAIVSILTGYFVFTSPKNMFHIAFDRMFEYIENACESSYKGILSITTDNPDTYIDNRLNVISKMDIHADYEVDLDKKIVNLEIDSNYKDSSFLSGNVYIEQNNAYILLEGIYDKYFKKSISTDSSIYFENLSSPSYQIMIESVKNAIKKSLKNKYFEKEKVMLNHQKVMKITLNLVSLDYQNFKSDVISYLMRDKDFLSSFSSISKKEIIEVKSELERIKNNKENQNIKVCLYLKNTNFLKLEFIYHDKKIIIEHNKHYNLEYYVSDVIQYQVRLKKEENTSFVHFNIYENSHIATFEITNTKEDVVTEMVKKDMSHSVSFSQLNVLEKGLIYTKLLSKKGVREFLSDQVVDVALFD